MVTDKKSMLFPDISEIASIKHWLDHDTDLSSDDRNELKVDFENINGSIPSLEDSSFQPTTALLVYYRQLIDLQERGVISVKLDRRNIVTSYALFMGSERNLLRYGAYHYHESPERLAERYFRMAIRTGDGENKKIAELLERFARDELRLVRYGFLDGEDKDKELNLYHYVIYCLEERDTRMSAVARYFLERMQRIEDASELIEGEDVGEYANRVSADDLAHQELNEHESFFWKVYHELPGLEDWRDGGPKRTSGASAQMKTLLLAFNREYELFEAFIALFSEIAIALNGFFETAEYFLSMPAVGKLLEEVADQVLFSKLTDTDRALLLDLLKTMQKGVRKIDVSPERDEYNIRAGLDHSAEIALESIRKDWDSGDASQTSGTKIGRGPLNYQAPWMGMMPAMQAGAAVLTAPFLGMPVSFSPSVALHY